MSHRLLVTGGAGFIGSHLIRQLLTQNKDLTVINLDALTYAGNLENTEDFKDHPGYRFVHGSILDAELVQNLVAQVDGIMNLAAESHVDRSIQGPQVFMETNSNGVLTLLDAVRKEQDRTKRKIKFLQVSTDEVYGSLGSTGFFTEETPLSPRSPYSASKASGDLMALAFHHTYNMDIVITRCSNNYGSHQFPEKLIPLMILRSLQRQPLPVYGDGQQIRDWIHVEDHCRGIWQTYLKGRSGQVYNFGARNEWTNLSIVQEILKMTDRPKTLIQYVTDRLGHDRRYGIDPKKAEQELGWAPKVPFQEGLEKTVQWYLSQAPKD